MNFEVVFDWKAVAALGGAAIGTIFALKMDANAAERVSIHAIDAAKEFALARNSGR